MATKYTPELEEKILSCESTRDFSELIKAEKLSATVETLRRKRRSLRQQAKLSADPLALFREFLSSGRTMAELTTYFESSEKQVEKWLAEPYDGFDLYRQRNAFNEAVYVYVPKPGKKWRPKDPIFARSYGETPWLRVQFPDSFQHRRLDLIPVYDVHYGHKACRVDKFREYVEYIRKTPNVFSFLGGDLIENSNRDSVGAGVYEQSVMPNDQIREVIEMLRPIAHKLLFSIGGNHEERTFKRHGIDVAQIIAQALEIPYFDEPVHADLSWGKYSWRIHAQHGTSGSLTPGGKINAATRIVPGVGDFVHAYFSGHVHHTMTDGLAAVCRNYETGELEVRKFYVIIMPAFLGYFGTYGARRGWAPTYSGSVRLSLYPNGDYHHGA